MFNQLFSRKFIKLYSFLRIRPLKYISQTNSSTDRSKENGRALKNLRDYLKIKSVHPNIDYGECVKFLKKQAKELNLPARVHNAVSNKPVVIITWEGKEPSLPSIMLNSHMDVVPVLEDHWSHPPFGAEIVDGKIFARGTQDMKSVGIQQLEAIRRLKDSKVFLKRTIHLSFVPDEEIGGADGMAKFVHTDFFKRLNIGFALCESFPAEAEAFILFYAEKCRWQFTVHCNGAPGHGAMMTRGTAGEKFAHMIKRIYKFRDKEMKIIEGNPKLTFVDVSSSNVTMVKGGAQINIIPPTLSFSVDCRFHPSTNLEEFEKTLEGWCKEAGEDVTVEWHAKESMGEPTKLDESNIFWVAFKQTADELGIKLNVMVCPGSTDMRFVRPLGIPAFGFTPINNTPLRAHGHDEYITVDSFFGGIEILVKIINKVANA